MENISDQTMGGDLFIINCMISNTYEAPQHLKFSWNCQLKIKLKKVANEKITQVNLLMTEFNPLLRPKIAESIVDLIGATPMVSCTNMFMSI